MPNTFQGTFPPQESVGPTRPHIRYEEFLKSCLDFSGLTAPGGIRGTDLDGPCFDFGDKGFLFIEVKHKTIEMPKGQELFFRRLADRLTAGGTPGLIIQAMSQGLGPRPCICPACGTVKENLVVAQMPVPRYYIWGRWHYPKNKDVKAVFDKFLEFCSKR